MKPVNAFQCENCHNIFEEETDAKICEEKHALFAKENEKKQAIEKKILNIRNTFLDNLETVSSEGIRSSIQKCFNLIGMQINLSVDRIRHKHVGDNAIIIYFYARGNISCSENYEDSRKKLFKGIPKECLNFCFLNDSRPKDPARFYDVCKFFFLETHGGGSSSKDFYYDVSFKIPSNHAFFKEILEAEKLNKLLLEYEQRKIQLRNKYYNEILPLRLISEIEYIELQHFLEDLAGERAVLSQKIQDIESKMSDLKSKYMEQDTKQYLTPEVNPEFNMERYKELMKKYCISLI